MEWVLIFVIQTSLGMAPLSGMPVIYFRTYGAYADLAHGRAARSSMRRSLTEDEQHKIADAIVIHLEQSNWKIEQGPSSEGHGPHLMPK